MMISTSHKTWQTSLLFLELLQIQNLKRKSGGTSLIMSPVSPTKMRLCPSPDELRIAIALRNGAKILESSRCRCGKVVDEVGLHGLSCTKNAGRFPRHSAINSILKMSLTRIGLSSTLEPVGLTNDYDRSGGWMA